jgi:hypothetical protein
MSDWSKRLPEAIDAAIRNVAAFGDTDLFPDPIEAVLFNQAPRKTRQAVIELHQSFSKTGRLSTPETLRALFPVGQFGYRLGSQIDPVWNLYLLSLVILVGPEIESARTSKSEHAVFSYRFIAPDNSGRIFDPEKGWRAFSTQVMSLCSGHSFAVVCDIADFYHRINSKMVISALLKCGVAKSLALRIGSVLSKLGTNVFGLPVGGPASRLLAEAILIPVDELLKSKGVQFCRFVDDIRLFSSSEAHSRLQLADLSMELLQRKLSLQKTKTRILASKDLLAELKMGQNMELAPTKVGALGSVELRRMLLANSLFDPYSGLRAQREKRLEEFAAQPGAIQFLRREFSKPIVNPALARNALSALTFMETNEAAESLIFLLDPRRQRAVLPVIGKLLQVLTEQSSRLDLESKHKLRKLLMELLQDKTSAIQLPAIQALGIRALQKLPAGSDPDVTQVLREKFQTPQQTLVRKEILMLYGIWGMEQELQRLIQGPKLGSAWERRALAWGAALASLQKRKTNKVGSPNEDICEKLCTNWLTSSKSSTFLRHQADAL